MNYRDTVFLSVAQHLSFSKAAEHLNISQPAVTKHIKELEHKYSANLFDRKGNKIYLTQAGKTAYNALKEIAKQYRDLDFEMSEMNDAIAGEFIIGASSTLSQYVIPKAIASFHKRYPKIQIHLINGNSFEMEKHLFANSIDMALVENASSQPGIRYKSFLSDELVVVTGAHSVYAKRKTISKEDLHHIPVALREEGSGTLEVIKQALQLQSEGGDKLNTHIHLGSTESIKNFLQDFDGIAVISEKAIVAELYLKSLVKLNVKDFAISRTFRIALRQGHKSKQVELFEDFILNYNF